MNVCKASGIAFLCFVNLCSLHGMESNSDSNSGNKEEVACAENGQQYIAFIGAILYGKARVDSGSITVSNPQTHESYQIDIGTAHRYFAESMHEATDARPVNEKFPACSLVHFFTDTALDLPFDIDEFDKGGEELKEEYKHLAAQKTLCQMSTNSEKGEVVAALEKMMAVSRKKLDGHKAICEYFEGDDRKQRYLTVKKKLQSNRAQLLDALRNKDIKVFSAVCQKPVQVMQLVQDSKKESGGESKIDDTGKIDDANDNGSDPESDYEFASW